MSDYIIPEPEPKEIDEKLSIELRHLADNAVLKAHPYNDTERCDTCRFYLEPTAEISYCWHQKLRILVGAQWWCRGGTPSPRTADWTVATPGTTARRAVPGTHLLPVDLAPTGSDRPLRSGRGATHPVCPRAVDIVGRILRPHCLKGPTGRSGYLAATGDDGAAPGPQEPAMRILHDDLGRRLEPGAAPDAHRLPCALVDRGTGRHGPGPPGGGHRVVHPPRRRSMPARVRGTKNPDHGAIARLGPDLVVANREENRRVDVERLRAAGIPVWVTAIESVDRGVRVAAAPVRRPAGGRCARSGCSRPRPSGHDRPSCRRLRVVVPIWRDPWMVVGSSTFAGDLVARLGLANVLADDARAVPEADAGGPGRRSGPTWSLLPDEPYPSPRTTGRRPSPDVATVLVSGRDLTWYGPSMATARADLEDAASPPPSADPVDRRA